MTIGELMIRYAALAWEKQNYLSDLLGEHEWQFDMGSGTLDFSGKYRFDVQLLGTVSQVESTWLWAWANTESQIPAQLLKDSERVRSFGQQTDVEEFTDELLKVGKRLNGHMLAMIASGICEANAYYRAPYAQGALFVLIQDEQFPGDTRHPIQRIALHFPQLIAQVEIGDHRAALEHYMQAHKLTVRLDDGTLVGEHADGTAITAEFDEQKRLTKLQTRLNE